MLKRFVIFFTLLVLLSAYPSGTQAAGDGAFIDVGALKHGLERGSVLAVDTRPANLFAQRHIPGSLNISPFAVKTKAFLRSKPLVLVDHPLSLCILQALRQELLNAGYAQVSILKGGIAAWYSEAAPEEISAVNKHTLAGALKCSDLRSVVIDIRDKKEFSARHPEGARHIPWLHAAGANRKEAFPDELGRSLPAQAGRDPAHPLIVVDQTGERAALLVPLLKKDNRPYSFSLQGGLADWYLEKDYPPGVAATGKSGSGTVSGGCSSCR